MSQDIINQAAAALIHALANGATAVGQHTPEIIIVAGSYLQFLAIAQLVVSLSVIFAILAVAWWAFFRMRRRDEKGAVRPEFIVTILFLIIFGSIVVGELGNGLPSTAAKAMDPRTALVGTVVDRIRR